MSHVPDDAPPSYQQATGTRPGGSVSDSSTQKLGVPRKRSRNGISVATRRSMEDEQRPLPDGWVRQFDTKSQHQFFVDTRANPPRSIWHHPYDDERYLESLDPTVRERIANTQKAHQRADTAGESTDEEDHFDGPSTAHLRPPPASAGPSTGRSTSSKKESLGQRMKDKLTGSTHEERERQRQLRTQEEQQAYERHRAIRQAMMMAEQTGQPQLVGRNREGHDIYIEPPGGPGNVNLGYPGFGGQYGGPRQYNPYAANSAYSNPNARFVRPDYAYSRRPGYGYGGGMGLPLAGGLLGGMMLGGMLGGF